MAREGIEGHPLMKRLKDFLAALFRGFREARQATPAKARPSASVIQQVPQSDSRSWATYAKGDFIGEKYEVHAVLGVGGFGVIYLVYSHERQVVYALKTLRDEFRDDERTKERFRKEAKVWVDLDRHPYILRASFVEEIEGRLYVAMDYIAPNEYGLNSLEGYLRQRPPDLVQSLRWALQFCHGMEYAYSRGVRCHRDIKPANILIGQDNALKISDFGLAASFDMARGNPSIPGGLHETALVALPGRTMEGIGFGTPTHMSPEQFTDAAGCDERSDIYSFGVVLFQMAAGGRLPFLAEVPKDGSAREAARFWMEMRALHTECSAPTVNSPLSPLIQRCLKKERSRRYQAFADLRRDLKYLLINQFPVARPGSIAHAVPSEVVTDIFEQYEPVLEAWEWENKGLSLFHLGYFAQSLSCFERSIEINPHSAPAWNNRAMTLYQLGRYQEAVNCFDKLLEMVQGHSHAWNNRGLSLSGMGLWGEALASYEKALEIDPKDSWFWYHKAIAEDELGRKRDAANSFRQFLALAPPGFPAQIDYAQGWLQASRGV